jgi:2'-5' RNA ligase
LPEAILQSLASLRERLRKSGARASWVKDGNMHLTLRFLGEVSTEQLTALTKHLAEVYRDCEAAPLSVSGVGAFPNVRRPSVVWVGMQPVEGPLAALQSHAEQAAHAIGLAPESKSFHPHVTLARIRDDRNLGNLPGALADAREYHAGDFTAEHVALFSSELKPGGPIYRRLEEFRLSCMSR